MGETVLLTGASGYIAKHTAVALLEAGHTVRGTVRTKAKGEKVRAALANHTDKADQITFVEADLKQDSGWAEAAAGCSVVLHMASPFPLGSPEHEDDLIVPAREGTLRVLKAAKAAGARRVVLTSSFAAVGYGLAPGFSGVLTEENWTDPESSDNSAYTKSKTIAEAAAWDYVKSDGAGLELVAINPALVLGPLMDGDAGASVSLLVKMLKGEFPGYPKMGFGVVDVRDVADYHARAVTAEGVAGERFIASNAFMWLGDMVRILKTNLPKEHIRRLPKFPLPNFMVRLASLTDRDVRDNLYELGVERRLDGSKARRTFGLDPRSSETAILDCAKDLIARGMI